MEWVVVGLGAALALTIVVEELRLRSARKTISDLDTKLRAATLATQTEVIRATPDLGPLLHRPRASDR
jgi:2-oxo-4-hydroxy-4-carboxy--5-ureidoimidazoline (OHCU) decarboxylase